MPFGNTPDDEDDGNGDDGEDIIDEVTDENGEIDEEKVDELIRKIDNLLDAQENAPEIEWDVGGQFEGLIDVLEMRQATLEDRMSGLEEQMSSFQDNLERLLFGPEGAPSPLEEQEPEGDLWDVGTRKETADSLSTYQFFRTRAANDTDNVSPAFSPDYDGIQSSEDRMVTYFELFRTGYASLREIYQIKLNKREWEMFVRELVDYHGITRGMVESDVQDIEFGSGIFLPFVDIINPAPSFFGFYTHGDELEVDDDGCPIPLLKAYGDWYFVESSYNANTGESRPIITQPFWEALDMSEPEEYIAVQGMDFGAFNFNMSTLIQSKDKYNIPDWMRGGGDFPGSGFSG